MRRGSQPSDRDFDRFLPRRLGRLSSTYWTPLEVVARAAKWLDELRVRTVVDVGSGSGKFCIAGALMSRCRFLGVEQRTDLVAVSRVMSKAYGVDDRTRFIEATFAESFRPKADAYYLFNPYGENLFQSDGWLDASVELSDERYEREVRATHCWLAAAPASTYVLTYNGFGGRMPRSYAQLRIARDLPCVLKLWRKLDAS